MVDIVKSIFIINIFVSRCMYFQTDVLQITEIRQHGTKTECDIKNDGQLYGQTEMHRREIEQD